MCCARHPARSWWCRRAARHPAPRWPRGWPNRPRGWPEPPPGRVLAGHDRPGRRPRQGAHARAPSNGGPPAAAATAGPPASRRTRRCRPRRAGHEDPRTPWYWPPARKRIPHRRTGTEVSSLARCGRGHRRSCRYGSKTTARRLSSGGPWPTLLKYPGLNKQISHNKTAQREAPGMSPMAGPRGPWHAGVSAMEGKCTN